MAACLNDDPKSEILPEESRDYSRAQRRVHDRPQLNAALEECRRSKATLVVAKLDRLSRNAQFLLSLQNSQVNFVCCDCPNVDRFTVGILALVTQRKRELIDGLNRVPRDQPLIPVRFSRRLKRYQPDLEIRWIPDGLRHAFATYWLGVHQDRNRLAELMGNSPTIIGRHYLKPVSRTEAQRFWLIHPPTFKVAVEFPAEWDHDPLLPIPSKGFLPEV